jgi:hypothetical protein
MLYLDVAAPLPWDVVESHTLPAAAPVATKPPDTPVAGGVPLGHTVAYVPMVGRPMEKETSIVGLAEEPWFMIVECTL